MKKTCSNCGETKAERQFDRDRGAKDGHRGKCKECRRTKRPPICRHGCPPEKEVPRPWNSAKPFACGLCGREYTKTVKVTA